ncbi:hypothetical protein SLS56_002054 [Neofusicoccum ribis]|uniref:Uncharacterized protein n=1 Tax=Neofusicoccum ribis TaxID=45134 RepID=A0ABR3T5W9_9PEZI
MAQQDMNAQQAKQTDPVFDDAAFDSAFDAAAAEVLEAERAAEAEVPAMAQADQRPAMSKWEEELGIMLPPETDETLAYMKEHAFGEYCRHQMTEYLPRTGTRDASPVPDYSLASLYMNALEKLQSEAKLTYLSPDPLLERVLNEMVNAPDILFNEQFMFSDRAQHLLGLIQNQQPSYFDQEASQRAREREDPVLRTTRLRMIQNSLQSEDDLTAVDKQSLGDAKINQLVADIGTESRLFPAEASRTVTGMDIRAGIRNNLSMLNQRPEALLQDLRSPPDTVAREAMLRQQPVQQEQNAEQQQPEQRNNDDEELARTAGQLVDSVSHDTSQKFVQSRFLALMRQLRDHEVRVDGDKIVETTPTSQIPTNQQDLDLGRGGGGGGDDSNMTMTGALQNDDHDIGELRA